MKAFYKIENNLTIVGSGTVIPEGFTEYEVGKEPEVLINYINQQIEEERVASIKAKASELILSKYSIIWQLNHPRTDATYASDYAYIDNIRDISNEAEANGTSVEDIDWGVL